MTVKLTADDIADLHDAHAAALLRYLARRTLEPEVAVDLMAETFARAITQRHRFRGSSHEEAVAWLYAIARNQLADFHRRGHVERAAMARLGMQRRALDEDEHDRIEALIDLRRVQEEVAAALRQLPHAQQEIVRLRVPEERSYAELAALIGITEENARARSSRALRALRDTPTFQRIRERLNHG